MKPSAYLFAALAGLAIGTRAYFADPIYTIDAGVTISNV